MPDNATVTTSSSFERPDSRHLEGPSVASPLLPRVLVVFEVGGQVAAFPIQNVDRIAPMARLAIPPGLPSILEGILNLAGIAVPVLRLDRLFKFRGQRLSLYSMLIVMKGIADSPIAMLVDRVSGVLTVSEAVLPVAAQNSFNDCADGVVTMHDQIIHLLSPARVLLAKERNALTEFQEMAQRRLQDWGVKEQ